jgi:hypothetical protein
MTGACHNHGNLAAGRPNRTSLDGGEESYKLYISFIQEGASNMAKAASTQSAAKSAAASKADVAPKSKKSDKPTGKKPAPAAKAEKPVKAKKTKLVRDSFTIPKLEYGALDDLKLRAAKLAQPAKKSELLRAGIKALTAMTDEVLLEALKAVPAIKTGRPKKD